MPDVTPRGQVVSHIRVEGDILGPSEALRKALDDYAHVSGACARPTALACMHGSAWRGDSLTSLHPRAGQLA